MEKHKIKWFDSGHEPKGQPNPDFPRGYDIDVSHGAEHSCFIDLPYPAKRIGHYYIKCRVCGAKVLCTTAGRVDDPKSVRMACKIEGKA